MSFVRKLLGRQEDKADETASTSPEREALRTVASSIQAEFGSTTDITEPALRAEKGRVDALGPDSAGDRTVSRAEGLRVGYVSDVGQLRDHNEDTLVAFQGVHLGDDASDPFGCFIVTDGMGGHRAGEVASSLAARLVGHDVLRRVYLPYLLDKTPGNATTSLTEILRDAVQDANLQVHQQVPGGGTTLTCALILGRRAYIAHVGDSRAYLLTNYDMKQVTQDHSYVSRLIELGELSPEEAAVHPQRHVLYRAIGQGDHLDIDTYHQPLPPGSRLLLCSDGLSGMVPEEEIGRIIASAATPQEACERLLRAANDAGGPDNITAVLIETPPD